MIKGYKIIGLCTTKLNQETASEFAEHLSREAVAKGYRLFIFNSFRDFYCGDEYDTGASSIYKAINFDILDALVIDIRAFYDRSIPAEIIDKAKNRNIPVIVLNEILDGCFCITKDYTNTYKSIIRHIIKDHGAKNLHFIAGFKGENDSETRMRCFKDVLAEADIPFTEDMVSYGNYWSVPVFNAVDKLVENGKLPDAIICVNDSSAIDVCDRLAHYGFRVPDDVLVTGFDGIQSASSYTPQISTCREDIPGLARNCMTLISKAVTENCEPFNILEEYEACISESCGCKLNGERSFREQAAYLFRKLTSTDQHENALYSWAERVFESTDIGIIGKRLYENVLPGSVVCINGNFLSMARKGEKTDPEAPFSQKMIVISAKDESYKNQSQDIFALSELYPRIEDVISEEVMFIFQPIFVADKVCGYYAKKTNSIMEEANKIHRLTRVINIAFGTLVSHIEQDHMTSKIEDMQNRDPLTEQLNLKGLIKRMSEINSFAKTRRIAVSVYSIAQYKYIYETYGIHDI